MLGKIFSVMVIISFISAGISGNMAELSESVLEGADSAVKLSLSMLGVMCLWSGIIRVLDKSGFTAIISRILLPFIRFVYPEASKSKELVNDIAADYSANLLGLGNAALPLGIKVMKGLDERCKSNYKNAKSELMTFAILNTTPFQLIPTTILSLKNAHQSTNPSNILLPIWVCSALIIASGIALCKFWGSVSKND